ncbi:MAG: prepilin peptidase [Planctomycetota bacterium]
MPTSSLIVALACSAAVLGAIVGSFLNVVIYRLPRGLGLGAADRSRCPKCGGPIRWFDNIPLVSYLALLGRCRHCKNPISMRYPIVEALTSGLFAVAFLRAYDLAWEPLPVGATVGAAFGAISVAVSFIDVEHRRLPRGLAITTPLVLAAVAALFVPGLHGTTLFGVDLISEGMKPAAASLLVGLAGAGAAGGLLVATRGLPVGIRGEDAGFLAAWGLLLGPSLVAVVLALALPLYLAGRAIRGERALPGGPLWSVAGLVALFFGSEILALVL